MKLYRSDVAASYISQYVAENVRGVCRERVWNNTHDVVCRNVRQSVHDKPAIVIQSEVWSGVYWTYMTST